MVSVTLNINGKMKTLTVEDDELLVDVLNRKLGWTGVKKACGEGECGSCTVILDGKAVNSCLILAANSDGAEIMTIEGLGHPEKLHPIQEAFVEGGAVQCGYCTPGMVLSAKALLDQNPNPAEIDVRDSISGNLCRCTGYQKIVSCILSAAEKLNSKA